MYQPKMSLAHSILIQDYVSYRFKQVRSDTYKFFQNWLRVSNSLIKGISIAFKDNYFMVLIILFGNYDHFKCIARYFSKKI